MTRKRKFKVGDEVVITPFAIRHSVLRSRGFENLTRDPPEKRIGVVTHVHNWGGVDPYIYYVFLEDPIRQGKLLNFPRDLLFAARELSKIQDNPIQLSLF